MRQFYLKVLCYVTPFVILFGLTEWYLYETGDIRSIEEVIKEQARERHTQFLRGYLSLDMNVYKWENIKQRSPHILVIGSSRVMQFRDFHFKPFEDLTYNAGGMLQSAHDVIQLGEAFNNDLLPKPKLILIGLDPWWFKKEHERTASWLVPDELIDHASKYSSRLIVLQNLFRTGFKDFRCEFRYKRNIGALAQFDNSGFRYDGSMAFSNTVFEGFVENPRYVDRGKVWEHITNGTTNRFTEYTADTALLHRVRVTLSKLQQSGTELIIYFPPFSTQSYKLLTTVKMHKEWWTFYNDYMIDLFKTEFDHLIPVECPEDYQLPDTFFQDGVHPSEVFVGIQWQRYVSNWHLKEFMFDITYLDSINNTYALPLSYQAILDD